MILNKTQTKNLINEIKQNKQIAPNLYRAIKEFLLKYEGKITHYKGTLYFIENKWLYDIKTPKQITPIPFGDKPLFCGFCDDNDDTYHYWLKDKKHLTPYGITYTDYKNFKSINWFITGDKKLYINHNYYNLKECV